MRKGSSILLLLVCIALSVFPLTLPAAQFYGTVSQSLDLLPSSASVLGVSTDTIRDAFQAKYGDKLHEEHFIEAVVIDSPFTAQEVIFFITHAELDTEDVRSGANVVWASSLSQQTVSFRNGRLIENGTELLFDNVTAELTADGNISFRGGLENGEVSETSLRYTPTSASIELSFSIPVGCGNDSLEENSNVAVTVTWYYDLSCLGQSLSKGVISTDDSCIANLVFH